jgi:hypothetical protein
MKPVYKNLFLNPTGKRFGTAMERMAPHLFTLGKTGSPAYDFLRRDSKNKSRKVELKTQRIVSKQGPELLLERALCAISPLEFRYGLDRNGDKQNMQNIMFQQVKPSCCEFIICGTVFLNEMIFYWVPAKDITPTVSTKQEALKKNKIRLAPQHRGHPTEGIITLRDILEYYDNEPTILAQITWDLDDIMKGRTPKIPLPI